MEKRDVHLYVFDGLADWETGYAIAQINMPQWQKKPGRYQVRTVGPSREPVTSMGGVRIIPDLTLDELRPEQSALLILPGGDVWLTQPPRPALDKVLQLVAAEVPVAGICGATAALAGLGLLDERAHTSNALQFLELQPRYHGAAHYREERAVRDRGIITASGMQPIAFAREIFKQLDLYEERVLEAWYGLFSTGEGRYHAELMQAVA